MKKLRTIVDDWVIEYEKQPKHTENLEMFICRQTVKHYEAVKDLVKDISDNS